MIAICAAMLIIPTFVVYPRVEFNRPQYVWFWKELRAVVAVGNVEARFCPMVPLMNPPMLMAA